jgi:hypothetical protein
MIHHDLVVQAVADCCRRLDTITFCYRWIGDEFKRQGVSQHDLRRFSELGHLRRVNSSRGGHRAYYELVLPD